MLGFVEHEKRKFYNIRARCAQPLGTGYELSNLESRNSTVKLCIEQQGC